jgi:hypothetical protein
MSKYRNLMLNTDLVVFKGKYRLRNGHFRSDFDKADRIQVLKPDTRHLTPDTRNLTPTISNFQ